MACGTPDRRLHPDVILRSISMNFDRTMSTPSAIFKLSEMFERQRQGRGRLPRRFILLASAFLFVSRANAFSYFPQLLSARTWLYATTTAPNLIKNAHDLIGLFETGELEERVVSTSKNGTIDFPQSKNQMKSIRSESPAVLLTSGPGTGKTHTLASRVAYLLREKLCPPQKMVIMSFSNRDAEVLKGKAIDQVFDQLFEPTRLFNLTKEQLSERLWGGTIHKFAGNIIRVYSSNKRALRVLSNHEVKMRIDRCVRQLLDEARYKDEGARGFQKLQKARLVHRDALVELRQSRDVMLHQIGRCIELWKESAMLPPPSVNGIHIVANSTQNFSQQSRDGCLELATRLGITPNVAYLAWSIFPLYQVTRRPQHTPAYFTYHCAETNFLRRTFMSTTGQVIQLTWYHSHTIYCYLTQNSCRSFDLSSITSFWMNIKTLVLHNMLSFV